MSYLSLLEKFNKTDSRLSRGEFFNFQLFSLYGMVIGNFFHLSVSFCAVRFGFAVAFRGQSIARCNYRWWRYAVQPVCATTTTWRSRVRFAAHFGGTRDRSSSETRLFLSSVPGDGSANPRRERKGNGRGARGRGQKKSVSRNSAPYARWHFQTTRGSFPPLPLLPSVLPRSAAVAEKFKFTHRLPRVCFSNLWKMSLPGRRFHFLLLFLSPPSALRAPRSSPCLSLAAFLSSPCCYATLLLRRGLVVYCRSCRRVKTVLDRSER